MKDVPRDPTQEAPRYSVVLPFLSRYPVFIPFLSRFYPVSPAPLAPPHHGGPRGAEGARARPASAPPRSAGQWAGGASLTSRARRGGAARGRCRGQCVPDRPPAMSRQSPAEENLQGKAAAAAGGCGHCPGSAGWGRHCPRSAGRTGAGTLRVAIWVIAIGDARRRAVHRPCGGREAGWMCLRARAGSLPASGEIAAQAPTVRVSRWKGTLGVEPCPAPGAGSWVFGEGSVAGLTRVSRASLVPDRAVPG